MNKNLFNVDLIVDEKLFIRNDQRLVVLFRKIVFKNLTDLMIKLNRSFSKKNELNELDDLMIENSLYYHEDKLRELDDLTIET